MQQRVNNLYQTTRPTPDTDLTPYADDLTALVLAPNIVETENELDKNSNNGEDRLEEIDPRSTAGLYSHRTPTIPYSILECKSLTK